MRCCAKIVFYFRAVSWKLWMRAHVEDQFISAWKDGAVVLKFQKDQIRNERIRNERVADW